MRIWRRLKYLLPSHRRTEESEMQAELESLAAMAEPGELGNLTRAAEEARAAWGWTWLEQLYRDGQYALRTLRHSPAFTATAVLSLALGIGANTAIFSLIDALMLRWLPVRNAQELVMLRLLDPNFHRPLDSFSNAIVALLDEQKDIFAHVCGFSGAGFDVGPRGSVSPVGGAWVTGDYYQTLGLTPALGRLLEPADDRPGAPLVAVISYGYWQRQFARNPRAIGQTIWVDSAPVTIAGVSPRGFVGADVGFVADVTMATAALPQLEPAAAGLDQPGNFWMRVLARPAAGVSAAQAKSRLAVVWPRVAERAMSPKWPPPRRQKMAAAKFDFLPGATGYSYLRDQFQRPLIVLMAVAGLVLLIACANVASLLLARATARQREISVRLAIGAGRGRIIRQLLTESTLLSAIGAVLGIWLAWSSSRFLVATLSGGRTPVVFDLAPNGHILGFAIALALATGLLFGLAPAWQTTAIGGSAVLKDDGRMTRSRSRMLSSLVSAQVALSLLLLVGAGLFVRTLANLLNRDSGFRREGVLLVDLDGEREGYRDARLTQFYSGLLERARHVPGVVNASISSHTPLDGSRWSEAVAPKGQPLPHGDTTFIAAGPDFFAAIGTPLLAGREFDDRDRGGDRVAIVNQSFADRFFPARNPVGEHLTATVTEPPSDLRIVGVVKDSLTGNLRDTMEPAVYVSYFQRPSSMDSLVIRAAGSLSQAEAAIRKELQPSFPDLPLTIRPLTAQVEETLLEERLMAKLSAGFGMLGLVLACVGLYGLLAYSVERRTKEIGVRVALGARGAAVLWMVAKRSLGLIVVGIAAGFPVAWVLARKVQAMLFGLTAMDAGVLAGAVVSLAAAGLVATYFPARRATRIDPMTALRHE